MERITPDATGPRPTAVLDAPSNLGLRPLAPDTVPGCYKAPWALRDTGLLERIGAADAGALVPPRYVATWEPGDGVRNGPAIASYARALADRVTKLRADGAFPVLLGGDCSILLGPALALRHAGRYGLAYLDAHADFRHLGNSPHVGAAAGEAVALVTGRGDDYLTDLDGLRPYVRDEDVILLGVRDEEDLRDVEGSGLAYVPGDRLVRDAERAAELLAREELDGFWIHLDADVLDPSVLPAVDSPAPGGLQPDELVQLVRGLVRLPGAAGLQVTIFDPDLDESGEQAALLADVLVAALE
ncbi:arginase family protein [Actinomadura sp. ATCC 31491]|uniref:Arginase family protein n=1 Tax=Actinomadura luzonensis TaxID=2805427 RepID=A0ABT0GBA4_9ACTN|nr:arginase family protein [Actinomadura luzonensis]MCK2221856.1 arginase family protein [Actinomadura luzonensis]